MASKESVNSLLRRAVQHVGGAQREPQVLMADAVARTLTENSALAVQAGPGTGKSLAYLVPALDYAVRHSEPVVISTATIALQRQLVDRDLPTLSVALAESLGRKPTFSLLKGRGNYLCLHKLSTPLLEEAPTSDQQEDASLFDDVSGSLHRVDKKPIPEKRDLGLEVSRVTAWAEMTETGDREEIRPGVSDRIWRQFSVTAGECLGMSRCPQGLRCWAEKARAVSAKVDIIVTNHAMLAIDVSGENSLLPDHSVVVVDEAHELVDNVTSVATGTTGPGPISLAVRRCGKLLNDELKTRLESAGHALGIFLSKSPEGFWRQSPPGALETLAMVRDSTVAALSGVNASPKSEKSSDISARISAMNSLEEIVSVCERSLTALSQENLAERNEAVWSSVAFSKETHDNEAPSLLHVAPVKVGGILRERLFREKTVVLTSATLTPGGKFDDLAHDWGLGGSSSIPFSSLDVGSPFAHAQSGICYIATHLPAPGKDSSIPEQLEVMEKLLGAARGRTLGLFSSLRAAQNAAYALREVIDTPILCQGEDTTSSLVDMFAHDPETSLFGTLSLWQGVDVPGPSLSLVMIDRIPFPRPDDPLTVARTHTAQAQGRNGFLSVSASHAAVLLAQGFGRLLRSVSDKGVVAVLDPRLASARYAGYLKASLPPFWETNDLSVTIAALQRLCASPQESSP